MGKNRTKEERPQQPKKLKMPRVPFLGNVYNARIYPLRDYGVKGIIWYQGEHNSIRFEIYSELLKDMVLNWREIIGSEVPFYYVQILVGLEDCSGERPQMGIRQE